MLYIKEDKNRVCPVELAGGLDNRLRKLFQNPYKILKPFVSSGMTVLDIGCGPGYFSVPIASMLGGTGKVISADLQEGMLEIIKGKITGTGLEQKIVLHKCEKDGIGITEKVDFILAFYMVHEVPDKNKLFIELKSILKPGGKLLIIEPPFHVSKKEFENMGNNLKNLGFRISGGPKVFFGRSVVAV